MNHGRLNIRYFTPPSILIVLLVLVLLMPVYLHLTAHHAGATGTTYYVDQDEGNDTCDGKGPAQNVPTGSCPWATVGKVNSTQFLPGDTIRFEDGETWTDTAPNPTSPYLDPCQSQSNPPGPGCSGASIPTGDGQITLTDYCYENCTLTLPIFDGNGDQATIELYDQQWWNISHLEIRNCGSCAEADRKGVWILADSTQAPPPGSTTYTYHHIYLSNLTVDNVMGINHITESNHNKAKLTGGIIVDVENQSSQQGFGTIQTNFDDLEITGDIVHDVHHSGIFLESDWEGNVHDNATPVSYYSCQLGAQGNWFASTDVVVDSNKVYNTGGDGIAVHATTGSTISNNTVHDGQLDHWAAEGIASLDNYDVIIRNNQVYGWTFNGAPAPYVDAVAFDIDDCDIGATIEYNWSHDNQGGFMLLVENSELTTVRYNISENDGYGGQDDQQVYNAFLVHNAADPSAVTGNGMKVYNNDIFSNDKYAPPGTSKGTALIPNSFGSQNWDTQPFFEDNLVENTQSNQNDTNTSCSIPTPPPSTNTWFVDYSDFYGGSQGQSSKCESTAPPQQPVITPYDPLFANPGNGFQATTIQGVIADYTVSQNPPSPALCAGVHIDNNGGYDFAGHSVPASGAVDAGALQESQNCP